MAEPGWPYRPPKPAELTVPYLTPDHLCALRWRWAYRPKGLPTGADPAKTARLLEPLAGQRVEVVARRAQQAANEGGHRAGEPASGG